MVYFRPSLNFGHENIIKYADRKHTDVKSMNEDLTDSWNAVVGRDDIVYHLGDFTLGGFEEARNYWWNLNGKVTILRNRWHHDRRWLGANYMWTNKGTRLVTFEEPMVVLDYPSLGKNGYPLVVVLCHYPMGRWDRDHYGAWHLHGHVHSQAIPQDDYVLDVGVENAMHLLRSYRPFSLREIIKIMKQVSKPERVIKDGSNA